MTDNPIVRFETLDLQPELLKAVEALGFTQCSDIQARSLPITLQGADLIGQAQTGTGKTAAFLLSILNHLLTSPEPSPRYASEPRALVLAPTRELALQIEADAKDLAKFTSLQVTSAVGGMHLGKQQQRLRDNVVDLLIATPGRLIDFESRKDVYLDFVEILVIDEADRMLDMGFIPDVRKIVRKTPMKGDRQTLLFSATFNTGVRRLADSWTENPHNVEIAPTQVATDTVEQKVYMVSEEEKLIVLFNLLHSNEAEKAIVFTNRRDQTRNLSTALQSLGMKCGVLSGDVPQPKRIKVLDQFKSGHTPILIATDVAGRGIHIDDITHVVNFYLPDDPEDYVHRIGRTGRAGSHGVSVSFASEDDAFNLPDLETYLGKKIDMEHPPAYLLKALPHAPKRAERERSRPRHSQSHSRHRNQPRGRR